ncbi:hypothetical protein OPV22_017270 [Ensete ventricosum]|uniref:Amino acid transporter transmembrane domain-containing protein n=1 Tax=Ensete ventricosum TaxID=4639 RepID=A0AAV8QZB6_ENSVE|nr:hypothetical protein OPV22_017270 [Ensete ventricosum]
MKADEEMGPDRGVVFETDDEDNLAHQHGGSDCSPSSSSPSSASSYDDHIGGDPSSYQTTWPQSYRPSIDIFSSVPSPRVGFLTGSNLVRVGSSFLRASIVSTHEDELSLTKPFVPYDSVTGYDGPEAIPPPDVPMKSSFAFASYCELPPPHQCSTAQAVVNGINVLCGVGLLSTPYAVKEGGWLGMLLLFCLASISFYTGLLLKRCLDSFPGIKTYPDIGHAAFGLAGRLFISIVLYLELYGCCVEYIILVSDSLTFIFPDASISFMGLDLSPHQLFAVTTAVAVLPTVWLKNLSVLSYLSGDSFGKLTELSNNCSICSSEPEPEVVNPLSKYALTMTPVALSLEELLPSTSQSNIVMILLRTFLVLSTLVVALTLPFFGENPST